MPNRKIIVALGNIKYEKSIGESLGRKILLMQNQNILSTIKIASVTFAIDFKDTTPIFGNMNIRKHNIMNNNAASSKEYIYYKMN